MNRIVKNKRLLIILSAIMIVVGLLAAGGAVALITVGAKSMTDSIAKGLICTTIGILLALLFLSILIYGIVLFVTGKAVVATNGSIKEDNLSKGTVNMLKCSNCGVEVNKNDKFCPKCGNELISVKKCSNCGKENSTDSNVCTECGEKL